MTSDFKQYWDRYFKPREHEGPDKRMPLAEAVRQFVKPGAVLHMSRHAQAAMNEVVRRFHGARPDFTFVLGTAEQNVFHLVGAGLVKRVVTSNLSNINPSPSPSRLLGRLTREGKIEMENWSLYTLMQRLMAGALGLEFMPTRSLAGSTIAEELPGRYATVSSPFSNEQWGLVKALRPDISVLHAVVADRAGNAIPTFGDGEAVWAARASKGGVIVTAEHLVPTSIINEYAGLVRIPAHMVRAVCHVPHGAHPQSLFSPLEVVSSYAEDVEFALAQRRATDDPDAIQSWLNEWVLDCAGHDAYLDKLGRPRLTRLLRAASAEAWREEVEEAFQDGRMGDPVRRSTEAMVVAAARRIEAAALASGYRVLLAGVGAGGLATYLAYYRLRDQGHEVEVAIGSGPFGHLPRLAVIDAWSHWPHAKLAADALDNYGSFLRGADGQAMGVLGAAMIDSRGNINSTRLPNGAFLIGSGGANDLAAGVRQALVVANHSQQRLVESVGYVTVPGDRVQTLVTDRGIMEKDDTGQFVLMSVLSGDDSLEERVEAAKAQCGWDLRVASSVAEEPPPTQEELTLVRVLDVRGQFLP